MDLLNSEWVGIFSLHSLYLNQIDEKRGGASLFYTDHWTLKISEDPAMTSFKRLISKDILLVHQSHVGFVSASIAKWKTVLTFLPMLDNPKIMHAPWGAFNYPHKFVAKIARCQCNYNVFVSDIVNFIQKW